MFYGRLYSVKSFVFYNIQTTYLIFVVRMSVTSNTNDIKYHEQCSSLSLYLWLNRCSALKQGELYGGWERGHGGGCCCVPWLSSQGGAFIESFVLQVCSSCPDKFDAKRSLCMKTRL